MSSISTRRFPAIVGAAGGALCTILAGTATAAPPPVTDATAEARFLVMDANQNGKVSRSEYVRYVTADDVETLRPGQPAEPNYVPVKPREARQRFKQLDRDGNGALDRAEVRQAMEEGRLLGRAAPQPGIVDDPQRRGEGMAPPGKTVREKFADRDTGEEAEAPLVKRKRYVPEEGRGQPASPAENPEAFVGATVRTDAGERIGKIAYVADATFSEFMYAVVDRSGGEFVGADYTLVPLGDLRLNRDAEEAVIVGPSAERLATMPLFERRRPGGTQ